MQAYVRVRIHISIYFIIFRWISFYPFLCCELQGSWQTWANRRPAEPNAQAEEALPPVDQAEGMKHTGHSQLMRIYEDDD
jgi:hypothetical protein